MDAERDTSVELEFHVGGFAAHCSNQREQKWIIKSNLENPVRRIRLDKNGTWKDTHRTKYALANEPHKFYDYNF